MSEEPKEQVEAAPEGSGKKNVVMMVLVLVIGIIIGGGGIYMALSMMEKPAEHAEEEVVAEEEAPATEQEPVKEDISFVEIKRMPATILDDDGRVQGYVFLDLQLEVLTARDPAFVQQRLPRIQAEFLKDISTHGISVPGKPGLIDFDGLSVRLTEAAHRTLGDDRVRNVFISKAVRS